MPDLVIYKAQNRAPCVGNIIISLQKYAQMRLTGENSKNLFDKILLILGQAQKDKQEENHASSLQNQSIHFFYLVPPDYIQQPFPKRKLKSINFSCVCIWQTLIFFSVILIIYLIFIHFGFSVHITVSTHCLGFFFRRNREWLGHIIYAFLCAC